MNISLYLKKNGVYMPHIDPCAERAERPTEADLAGCTLREVLTDEGRRKLWVVDASPEAAFLAESPAPRA